MEHWSGKAHAIPISDL